MPNKPAARKYLRQTKKHTSRNLLKKDAFRGAIKNVLKAKTADEAKKLVLAAQKALGKAAKAGTIKKNTAARKLSRLMKKVNALAKK